MLEHIDHVLTGKRAIQCFQIAVCKGIRIISICRSGSFGENISKSLPKLG
jgi:hypothetical protein